MNEKMVKLVILNNHYSKLPPLGINASMVQGTAIGLMHHAGAAEPFHVRGGKV